VADPAVLRLENLGRRYAPDRPALFERLELELKQGEYLAVMGESGVGKSTLLNTILGQGLAQIKTWPVRSKLGDQRAEATRSATRPEKTDGSARSSWGLGLRKQ